MLHVSFVNLLSIFIFVHSAMNAQDNSLQHWQLKDFMVSTSQPVYWKEIYQGETIRVGYYHLKAGAKDDQNPHEYDEVYWIENGKSKIRIGAEDFDIKQGDIVYVQAKQVHFFHEIEEDLDILVLFSKGPYDTAERIDQIDHIPDVSKSRDEQKNVRNDFLKKKSMTFGLYMLPKSLGGDQPLTHKFDEFNFVVQGSATFTAGEQSIDVKPGSLFFVSKNTPHQFSTKTGIDTFILFETKSAEK